MTLPTTGTAGPVPAFRVLLSWRRRRAPLNSDATSAPASVFTRTVGTGTPGFSRRMASRTTYHGLPALDLTHPSGAQATVLLHGAHVVAWKPAGTDTEALFMSTQAVFEPPKPVRGGTPGLDPGSSV